MTITVKAKGAVNLRGDTGGPGGEKGGEKLI